ncbi:MAG: hypothetical protein WD423_10130 [Rhodothermales bacterium]
MPRFKLDFSRFNPREVFSGKGERSVDEDRRPDVVLDFEFRDGLFFISIRNIGSVPALDVGVEFAPSFTGVGGAKNVTELPLFNDLTYLAPGRRIETFLDTSASYFHRDEPTRVKVRVHYRARDGTRYEERVEHNLEIYRELGYVGRQQPGGA